MPPSEHTAPNEQDSLPRRGSTEFQDAVKRDHYPDNYDVLGYVAVTGRLDVAQRAYNDDDFAETERWWADIIATEHIPKAREELEGFSAEQRAQFQRQLEDVSDVPGAKLPGWLVELIQHQEKRSVAVDDDDYDYDYDDEWSTSLVDGLIAKNSDGSYRVGDDTFVNFLEWHNYITAQRQIDLDSKTEQLKTDYKNRIQQAVIDGWIPQSAAVKLCRLEEAKVLADDGLSTTIHGWAGLYKLNPISRGSIYISPWSLKDSLNRMFIHEATHAIQGYSAFSTITSNNELRRVLREAVTEHVTNSLLNGNPEVTDTGDALRSGASYYQERTVLDSLCKFGEKLVDVKLFIAASFEDSHEAVVDGSATSLLIKALKEAFPGEKSIIDLLSGQDNVVGMKKMLQDYVIRNIFL